MRGVEAAAARQHGASSSGLRACDGLGKRAMIDGMPMDGVDPETGWIDEAIWARLSQDDRWRHYELVQNMLWKKFEDETPPPPDEEATAQQTWQEQSPKEKKPQQVFSISETHEFELLGQIQKYVESKVGGAWYEYDEILKNHANLRQQLKHDELRASSSSTTTSDELHDLSILIQNMAVALVTMKKGDLTARYIMAKKYDELKYLKTHSVESKNPQKDLEPVDE